MGCLQSKDDEQANQDPSAIELNDRQSKVGGRIAERMSESKPQPQLESTNPMVTNSAPTNTKRVSGNFSQAVNAATVPPPERQTKRALSEMIKKDSVGKKDAKNFTNDNVVIFVINHDIY